MCTPACRATSGDAKVNNPLKPGHWPPFKVQRHDVFIEFQEKKYHGRLVAPSDNKKRPLVIVAPNFQGLKFFDEHQCEYMARLGYVGLAIDTYGDKVPEDLRLWPEGEAVTDPSNIPEKLKAFFKATFQAMVDTESDDAMLRAMIQKWIDVGLAHPTVDKSKKPAVIGYCYGGVLCLECIRGGLPVAGVCSFHGVLVTGKSSALDPFLALLGVTRPEKKTCENNYNKEAVVYVENGILDEHTFDSKGTFLKEFHEAGVDFIFSDYAGAPHGFALPKSIGGAGMLHEKADRRSTCNMLKMFREIWPGVPQNMVEKNAAGTVIFPGKPVKPPELKKAKVWDIGRLKPNSAGFTVMGKVLGEPKEIESKGLCEVSVGDATGKVTCSLKTDQAEMMKASLPDSKVMVFRNARIVMVKGFMRLVVDKWGKLEPSPDNTMDTIGDKDISATEFELVS